MYFMAVALLMMFGAQVAGYGSGAPRAACTHLAPIHHGYKPQPSVSPYKFILDSTTITANQAVLVTITGSDWYTGFLIQAKSAHNAEKVGAFADPMTGEEYKLGPCHIQDLMTTGLSSATHTSTSVKQNITLWWYPAGFTGLACFSGTVAKDHRIFWINIVSEQCIQVREFATPSNNALTMNETSTPVAADPNTEALNYTGDLDSTTEDTSYSAEDNSTAYNTSPTTTSSHTHHPVQDKFAGEDRLPGNVGENKSCRNQASDLLCFTWLLLVSLK